MMEIIFVWNCAKCWVDKSRLTLLSGQTSYSFLGNEITRLVRDINTGHRLSNRNLINMTSYFTINLNKGRKGGIKINLRKIWEKITIKPDPYPQRIIQKYLNCHNPNSTTTQHNKSWVWHKNDFTPPPPTTGNSMPAIS